MTAVAVSRPAEPAREASARGGDRIALGLVLGMALCVSGAINDVGWAEGTSHLILQSVLAVLLAYSLAHSRLHAWQATVIGTLAMLALVFVTVGGLWPPLAYLREDVGALDAWWRAALSNGPAAAGWPFPQAGGYIVRQVAAMAWRVWVWGWRVYTGGVNSDRQVWLLVISTALSLTTFTAAWQVFRRWSASLALLLLGAALGTNSFMAGQAPTWALAFIGLGLVLLARSNALSLERRWLMRGTDYSDELLPYATVIGLALAAAAIIISPLPPLLTSRSTYEAFWRVFREPWSRVEDTTGRWFQGLDSPQRRNPLGGGEGGPIDPSLEHPVGAGAPRGNQVVLRVRTGDPAPEPWAGGIGGRLDTSASPQRHWRGATYDTYTGSGWANRDRSVEAVGAGQDLPVDHPEGRRELLQHVQRREPGTVIYAVGQPLRIDQDLDVTYRAQGDVVTLSGDTDGYDVVSLVPDVTVSGLEAAGSEYPPDIADRYVALPDLPGRVRQLALDVAAGAETEYGKARAIEEYLRQFEYELAVPAAPPDRDVVDYFLFDLQRGFCDHYSSAMAVMLRLNGVPARVAVGYARGAYDDRDGYWVATEADAHAWVEVYFPGFGWVEFEPTPTQAVYAFPFGDTWDRGSAALPDIPEQSRGWWPRIDIGTARLVAVATLVLVVLVRVVAVVLRRRRYGVEDHIAAAYGSIVRYGGWIGVRPRATETVREYWQRLRQALSDEAIFVSTPWGTEWVWQFDRVSSPLRYVLTAYERAQFGPDPLGPPVARRARQEATRLRREFALLWVARRIGD